MEIPHLNKNSSTAVFREVLCKCTTLAWKLPVLLVLDGRNVVRTDTGGIIIADSILSLILYLLGIPTRRRESSPKLRIYVRNLAVVSCTASNIYEVLRNLQHLAERGRRVGLTSRLASINKISLHYSSIHSRSVATDPVCRSPACGTIPPLSSNVPH